MKSKFSIPVVVSSCDPYSDLWRPFFTLLFKNWPDIPTPTYLITNSKQYEDPRVETVAVGGGTSGWTDRLARGIATIQSEYLYLLLEDFFFQSPVDAERLRILTEFALSKRAHMLRLVSRPGPAKVDFPELEVGELFTGAPYRVSTQGALWNRQSLLKLLTASESIWEFEHRGSDRSDSLFPDGMFSVSRDLFTYRHHVVEKGKWFPWSAARFSHMNIGVDLSKREQMTASESGIWLARKGYSLARSVVTKPKRPKI